MVLHVSPAAAPVPVKKWTLPSKVQVSLGVIQPFWKDTSYQAMVLVLEGMSCSLHVYELTELAERGNDLKQSTPEVFIETR